jgi:hypothetical protein
MTTEKPLAAVNVDLLIALGMAAMIATLSSDDYMKFKKQGMKLVKKMGVAFTGDPDFQALWEQLAGCSPDKD